MMLTLELPYPPSLNHYYRHVGGKVLISAEGRRYRADVASALLLAGVKPVAGRLTVALVVEPPDRRARDLDNVLKALLDALTHGGLWDDDSQIDRLMVEREEPRKGGRLTLRVGPVEGP